MPVNVRVDQAIASHLIAFSTFHREPDDPDARQLAMFTLQAVILAWTPEVEAYRRQLEYLTSVPKKAWPPYAEHSAAACREATLAAIARSLNWAMVAAYPSSVLTESHTA